MASVAVHPVSSLVRGVLLRRTYLVVTHDTSVRATDNLTR